MHSIKHAWEVKPKNVHMDTLNSRQSCSRIDAIFSHLFLFDQTKHHRQQQQQPPPRQREFYLLFSSLCFSLDLSFYHDLLVFPPSIHLYILTTSATLYTRWLWFDLLVKFIFFHWLMKAYKTCIWNIMFYCASFGRFMASSMKINFQAMLCVCVLCCALADNRLPNCLCV